MTPTAWARVASLFVDYGVRRGLDRAALLAAGSLREAVLADPDGRVPLTAIYEVLELVERHTGDHTFGLELPLGLEVEALDAVGFLFITSPTLGSALDRMLRYQRLWNEGERLDLELRDAHARVTYEPWGPARPAHVQMALATMCDFVANTPRFIPGLAFERVCFRHPRPADVARYERVLGVPVEFGAGVDEARFAPEMMDLPIPDANAALCAFFERYASDKLRQLPERATTAERVRALLRKKLPDGGASLAELAASLHTSARTLQRRLGDEGTSLQAELDEVRRQQALYFLESGTAISELSWLLGYSEPSAFHRAFKRWTGTSPEVWRAGRGMIVDPARNR